MSRTRDWMLFAALLALLALRPWASRAETGVTDKEILFGTCLPLEGPQKLQGTEMLRGAQDYIRYLNDEGGIHGRKLRLISYNDGYEPDLAIVCFKKLLDAGIFAAIPFYGAPAASKYVPMAESNKIPLIGFGTGARFLYEPVKRYVFNARASFIDESGDVIGHLWNDLGIRKFGAIYQDDAGGVAILEGVTNALAKLGGSVSVLGSFSRNSLNVDDAIKIVQAANPEAVFLMGPYPAPAEVLKRAKAENWHPLFVAIGPRDPIVHAAGDASDGVIVSQVVPPPNRTDLPTIRLYDKISKKYSPDFKPGYYGLEATVNAMLVGEALKRAGKNVTRESFIDALESLGDWDIGLGPSFKVKLDKDRHGAFDRAYLMIAHGGRLAVIEDWSQVKKP